MMSSTRKCLIIRTTRYFSQGLVTGVSITSDLTNKALISLQKYHLKEADGILKEAEKVMLESGQRGAKPFDYYTAKSLYHLKMNEIEPAQMIFNEAREYYPHLAGHGDFAYFLMQNGNYKECIDYVERKRLNEIADLNYYHWYMMSSAYGGLKDYEQSLAMNTKAMEIFEEYGDYDTEKGVKMKFVKQRGELLCALNRYEEALPFMEEQIKTFEGDEDSCNDRIPFLILKSFWIRATAQHIVDNNIECGEEELKQMKQSIFTIISKLTLEDHKTNREIQNYCIGALQTLKIDFMDGLLDEQD